MRSLTVVLLMSVGTAVLTAAPAAAAGPQRATYDSYSDPYKVVREDGKIIGRDPDANVRYELMRDAYGRDN
jgi:hypothetical protein